MKPPHVERIAAFLSRPGMTKLLLAQAAGVHRNTLEGFDRPEWNPHQQTIDKILAAVNRLERAIGQ